VSNQQRQPQPRLTEEQIEVRVWAFVVGVVTMILAGIVFFILYSVTFVTQPIKSMAPIDQAYTKMLNDIVLLIVGGIGGVMAKKGVQTATERFAGKQDNDTIIVTQNPTQTNTNTAKSGMPDFNWMGFSNPKLDEDWRPPPPPTTPADHLHPEREEIAEERSRAQT
jgi:hypothetical protein